MTKFLLIPVYDLVICFFIVQIVSCITMFLHHHKCTFFAQAASFLIISAYLSTFFMLFFILFIDCSFNFDLTTNVLNDFFVATNYLSSSFTWFWLIQYLLYKKGWALMKDPGSLNARFCLPGSVATISVWRKLQLNFSLIRLYFSIQSEFLWFFF